MAKLIYTVLMSLDGYIADNGNFDWAEPDEEVHSFVNELARDDGTYLYGRRMYEVMAVWQTLPTQDQPSFIADFANIWRAADKVVYSKTRPHPLPERDIRLELALQDECRFRNGMVYLHYRSSTSRAT